MNLWDFVDLRVRKIPKLYEKYFIFYLKLSILIIGVEEIHFTLKQMINPTCQILFLRESYTNDTKFLTRF